MRRQSSVYKEATTVIHRTPGLSEGLPLRNRETEKSVHSLPGKTRVCLRVTTGGTDHDHDTEGALERVQPA